MVRKEEKTKRLLWVQEVNKRSPHIKYDDSFYDGFIASGLTIALWLRQRQCDPAYTEEDYPYGVCHYYDDVEECDDYDDF